MTQKQATHSVYQDDGTGNYRVAKPLRAPVVRWVCSHHWHAADAMIAWFCCRCGDERDGMPRDGRDRVRAWLGGRLFSYGRRTRR